MADVIFFGNLGADSEIRYTPSGSPVLKFRIADSKSKKDGNGGFTKIAENWFSVEMWGSMAEFLSDKLLSGVRVKVYGEFYQRAYEGKNGPGISLDVKASAIEVLTSKRDRPLGDSPNASYGNQQHPAGQPQNSGWGGSQPAPNAQTGNNLPPTDPWATPTSQAPF
ncbi:single-stranded DNA-binding protein [Arthrobacter sp. GMC3]|uniref:single-stranded DNA-binding protein n=1 Tax=Arthrobacter sp. GMC3 TaxID=2058894 RepID=UPI000CE32A89|nr:single-stranded DNA-binding protein [Arthrobacter sp. GMC3]